jgi:hypothetical protein
VLASAIARLVGIDLRHFVMGDTFFFYDPGDNEAARRFPFATIVTNASSQEKAK